jgi:hypothetical protein
VPDDILAVSYTAVVPLRILRSHDRTSVLGRRQRDSARGGKAEEHGDWIDLVPVISHSRLTDWCDRTGLGCPGWTPGGSRLAETDSGGPAGRPARDYGSEGWGFESLRARQQNPRSRVRPIIVIILIGIVRRIGPRVCGARLVCFERSLVSVKIVEDPSQRLALHPVGGVDERSGLVGLDALDGMP